MSISFSFLLSNAILYLTRHKFETVLFSSAPPVQTSIYVSILMPSGSALHKLKIELTSVTLTLCSSIFIRSEDSRNSSMISCL